MSEPWFRQRSYGYGSMPATWHGWAAIVAFVAAAVILALLLFVTFPVPAGQVALRIIFFLILLAILLYLFLALVRRKTAGTWRWRWGGKKQG